MVLLIKMMTTKNMMRLTTFALIVGILMACGSGYEQEITKDENGDIKSTYTVRKEDGLRHGEYSVYIEGKLYETGTYEDDKRNGIRTIFDENEKKIAEETYKDDKLTAKKEFFPKGQLKSEGQYDENQTMTDIWKFYYENGELKEEVTFNNNIEDGPFVEYYENGNKKAEGAYQPFDLGYGEEGMEHGELKEYDESGNLIAKKDCKQGRCTTIWRAEQEENQ